VKLATKFTLLGAFLLGLAFAGGPAAASCQIVGDSIAVGTSWALPGCRVNAKVGIPSYQVIARTASGYDWTVISAGSNDPLNPMLEANLRAIRKKAGGPSIWIVPQSTQAAATVMKVAKSYREPVVHFIANKVDHVHPVSYPMVSRDVLSIMRNGQ
jgi:hypothetical protein